MEALPRDMLGERWKLERIWNLEEVMFLTPREWGMQDYLENLLFDLVQIPSAAVIFDEISLLFGSIM